ncbi:MAG: peptide chain release factor N(5)-glutamine methyltransferase [Candidatus Moraniibacteriota bacterium]
MSTVQNLQKKYLPGIMPEDFFVLIAHATGKEKVFLLAHPEYELSAAEEEKAKQHLERRLKHEPVAYITGHKEFYGRDFHVTHDTLIPRPETELMIEQVLDRIKNTESGIMKEGEEIDLIDIGTGSGNIIITLAKEFSLLMRHTSYVNFYALDISPRALAIAEDNARTHSVGEKISFIESDLLQNFSPVRETHHPLIVTANLPYLSHDIYQGSDADVRDYEPQGALESGVDGLDHYRRLLLELKNLVCPDHTITLLLEISPEQTLELTREIQSIFPDVTLLTLQDLSGRDRLIQASL